MTNEFHAADLRRKQRKKIIIFVVGTLVGLAILFTILGLTFFKPKRPVTTINNVAIQGAHVDFTKLNVNLTLLIDLSIKNPNQASFKFDKTVAYLRYKDKDIGEAPIEEGEIGRKETKKMDVTMSLMGDKLFDIDMLSQARSLPLSTYVALTGRVQLLVEVEVKSYLTCNFNIDAWGGDLSNLSCHYDTKFE